jgi:hypothetical protein
MTSVYLGRFNLHNFIYLVDFWSLSMYAGRQCREEIKMLYGMVKNFIRAGDASIVIRRKEEVVQLD